MVRSESELSRMTKRELMQWLTKHDQRLPPNEKLKKYYLQRAIEYFRLLETEREANNNSNNEKQSPSRSEIKHKGTVVSNERTKKKLSQAASQQSKTPTSVRQTVKRTQRRHSAIHDMHSPSASLTRSKRKVIKIKRKTPTKQSPGLSKSMKKTRERMRRATADPAKLREYQQEVNADNNQQAQDQDDEDDEDEDDEDGDDDDDEVDIIGAASENEGDFHNMQRTDNLLKRKFVCRQDPEKMTVSNLQAWLDENSIDFETGQRKQSYVNLVKKYSVAPSQENTTNHHRHVSSPERSAPLPRTLRMSPLTPQDDEKNAARSRIPEKHQQRARARAHDEKKSGGLLLTPALNKTGVSRIDTPSKLAMRDEIRNLLGDDSEDPLRPMKMTDDGMTPGGPSNYDADELNNVLSDLRRENDRKQESPARVKVFHPKSSPNDQPANDDDGDDMDDEKANAAKPSTSIFSSFLNAISPHKPVSPKSMKQSIHGALSNSSMSGSAMNTDKKRVHKLNRTLPSPVSSPADSFGGSPVGDHNDSAPLPNNGNFSHDPLVSPAPMHLVNDTYNQEEDLPQTPAISNEASRDQYPQSFALNNPRRSNRLQNKFKAKSPPKSSNNNNMAAQPTIYEHGSAATAQQVNNNQKLNARGYQMKSPSDSSAISPSIPAPQNMQQQQPLQNKRSAEKTSTTFQVLKWLFPTILVAAMAWIFTELDGMSRLNQMIDDVTNFIDNIGAETPTLFCDTDSTHIASMDSSNAQYECEPCPKHAVRCSRGRVLCQTNYILRDNKCILDGVLVKFAFEIKSQAVKILSERRGKYECGEIDVDGYTMNEDELLSNVEILDAAKKQEAFVYFKANVLPDQALIGVNDKGKYFSYKSIKSPVCKMNEWVWSNVPFLVATLCLMVILAAIYCNCRKQQNEKKQLEVMVNEIYKILEEYREFDDNKHVPVDVVRQRMKPKSNSNKLWRAVENSIYKDCRITKSVRMIDGMQRNCWKLSSVSLMNRSKSPMIGAEANMPTPSNMAMGSNQQHPGFTFTRSNEAAQETRFPAYSKRAMW